jgi:hypothetical protein
MNSSQVAAKHLLEEIEGGWLEVAKVPGNQGGYIRVPVSVNAEWYSRFCQKYESRRSSRFPKHRTIIKRCHTIAALEQIISGRQKGVYIERLQPFLEEVHMSVIDRTGVTAKAVREELADLEGKYKEQRKVVLDKVTKPYQERRKKLTRLLAVLEDEKVPADASD